MTSSHPTCVARLLALFAETRDPVELVRRCWVERQNRKRPLPVEPR